MCREEYILASYLEGINLAAVFSKVNVERYRGGLRIFIYYIGIHLIPLFSERCSSAHCTCIVRIHNAFASASPENKPPISCQVVKV